jgi:hypothetical protein
MPGSPCRSEPQRRTAEDEDARKAAVMRAIGDLRGQLATIAAHVGLSPWPPKAHSASAPGKAKRRRRSRRKMTLPDVCKELPPFEPSRGVR